MHKPVELVGLDCGTTTTSLVAATARVTRSATGRMEITQLEPTFRSPLVFTPFDGALVDEQRLAAYLDEWLALAAPDPGEIVGGGAMITGLAAARENAAAIARAIEERLGESVIATAGDPQLESWLAFMGNCHALSLAHPAAPLLNLDIGGGTTNLALGIGGQVVATACLMVGARHLQFEPGTYRLRTLSDQATALLEHLGIDRRPGDELEAREVNAILDWQLGLIAAAVEGDLARFDTPLGRRHVQVAPRWPKDLAPPGITLSGGVGQLAYARLDGAARTAITQFGDLGGELAARLVDSPTLGRRIAAWRPEGLGRATVYGLLRHATELSGTTLFLPHPERLPLANVPIVARLGPQSSDEAIGEAIELAAHAHPAGCIQVEVAADDLPALRALAARLAGAIESPPYPRDRTLVLLAEANLGKALGNYVTRWGRMKADLIVVDEVPNRDAQFVRLGRVCEGTVPVSLYGMR